VPFGGNQNASICLVGKQSEQLRLFLVGSASASLRCLAARSWLKATHLAQYYPQNRQSFLQKSKAPEAIQRPYRPTGYIRPPILMALILTRQPRLSTQRPRRRNKPQLFRCERPVNRALGFRTASDLVAAWPVIIAPATDVEGRAPRSAHRAPARCDRYVARSRFSCALPRISMSLALGSIIMAILRPHLGERRGRRIVQ
jgi:hypothetical protein